MWTGRSLLSRARDGWGRGFFPLATGDVTSVGSAFLGEREEGFEWEGFEGVGFEGVEVHTLECASSSEILWWCSVGGGDGVWREWCVEGMVCGGMVCGGDGVWKG